MEQIKFIAFMDETLTFAEIGKMIRLAKPMLVNMPAEDQLKGLGMWGKFQSAKVVGDFPDTFSRYDTY